MMGVGSSEQKGVIGMATTRTLVDIDDDLLARASAILGTSTKKATVNAALEDVVKRRLREQFLERLDRGELPDLTGDIEPDPAAQPPSGEAA